MYEPEVPWPWPPTSQIPPPSDASPEQMAAFFLTVSPHAYGMALDVLEDILSHSPMATEFNRTDILHAPVPRYAQGPFLDLPNRTPSPIPRPKAPSPKTPPLEVPQPCDPWTTLRYPNLSHSFDYAPFPVNDTIDSVVDIESHPGRVSLDLLYLPDDVARRNSIGRFDLGWRADVNQQQQSLARTIEVQFSTNPYPNDHRAQPSDDASDAYSRDEDTLVGSTSSADGVSPSARIPFTFFLKICAWDRVVRYVFPSGKATETSILEEAGASYAKRYGSEPEKGDNDIRYIQTRFSHSRNTDFKALRHFVYTSEGLSQAATFGFGGNLEERVQSNIPLALHLLAREQDKPFRFLVDANNVCFEGPVFRAAAAYLMQVRGWNFPIRIIYRYVGILLLHHIKRIENPLINLSKGTYGPATIDFDRWLEDANV